MTKDERIEKLQDALKWALDEGAHWVAESLYSSGCGCCSYEIKPPPHVYELIYQSKESGGTDDAA